MKRPMTPQLLPRHELHAMVLGGPTTVLDYGGLRIVSDPTFDPPGPHGYITKTAGPALPREQRADAGIVLVSHDNHPDNLDDAGRDFAQSGNRVITVPGAATRLGRNATGLSPWTSTAVRRP